MNKHTTIYNLTDQQMRMHAGYQWALGEATAKIFVNFRLT